MADPREAGAGPAAGNGLDGFLQAAEAGAYAVNEHGQIIAVNPAAERLLARPSRHLLGRDAHDLLHRDAEGKPVERAGCLLLRAMLAGRIAPEQAGWFERGDGSVLPVSWLATPFMSDDETTGALVVFHQRSASEADREQQLATVALSELERLALLAETTSRLSSTLNPEQALRRLARIVLPRLADWVVVDLVGETDDVHRALVMHYDNGHLIERADLCGPLPPVFDDSPFPLSRALRGGRLHGGHACHL